MAIQDPRNVDSTIASRQELESIEERNKRLKEIADKRRVTQELQASKPKTTMEDVSPQETKTTTRDSNQSAGVQALQGAATVSGLSAKKKDDDMAPGAGMDKAASNAMQAGVATGGNPFAMAGAAAIGLLQASEEREAFKIKKLEEAKLAEASSKESESKIYQQLAQSMRGMLR